MSFPIGFANRPNGVKSRINAAPGHSSLPQRRLESDAARRSGSTVAAGAGATPAAFYLGLCRLRGILSLPASHDCAAGGPFFFAAKKIRIGRGRSLPLRNQQAKPFSPASIPKSGPEIKNRCTHEGINRQNLAAIPKLTPSNQESLHAGGRFRAKTCSDSQVDPLKSRITAEPRSFPGKTRQRFPSLGPKSRIDAVASQFWRRAILLCRYET